MSSTCLAARRLELVSNSSSWDVGVIPKPLAVFLSFSDKALDTPLVPTPGLRRRQQCLDSSRRSNPGRDLSTYAEPYGNVKHGARSCSPAASTSPK
eukprot:163178-Pyramimonas_sp.AAC.2